ncbi:MAG TPA: aminotransferase class I/II-fold pyridoxal phosphate-dependent enzyme [Acidimicrobiales bacterium]|nr:aminotransferase class I/II-fold pyridoxal phosphate-dependent enzyme [Acidimicrobiales bacterium]
MPSDRLAIDGGDPVLARPLDIGRGVALLGDEERKAVLEVLESRSLFRYYGPNLLGKVEAFERGASDLIGSRYAVATSSGTAAIRAALAALGVGCGDEVVVPAFTFIATVNAVVTMGAVPVFAEIDESWGMDPADLDGRITARTAAVVPVHLENCPCDMGPLLETAARRGVPVLEDAAQSMGASYRGRALGTLGALGAFSLQLEKNVTSGEGGLVVTDDETLHLRAARYQDQGGQFVTSTGSGRGEDAIEAFVGENLRMAELAGAIAGVQLTKLPGLLAAQRANHRRILDAIGSPPGVGFRHRPDPDGDGCSSIGFFLPDANLARRFAKALIAEGVPAGRMYRGRPVYATESILQKRTASGKGGPWNCAEHPTSVEYRMGMCPRTEDLAARSALVVVAPGFTAADCDAVSEAVLKVGRALLGP